MALRLSDLKNFLEAAPCTTLREGANRLGISQPALSESIKRLEQDVGAVLFYRTKTGVSLTPRGREVLEHARRVQTHLGEIEAHPSEASSLAVTVGCHAVVAAYTLPVILPRVPAHYRIEIRHGLSREIQDQIQRGHIDLGLVINPVPNPDLVIIKLATDRVGVWSNGDKKIREQLICDTNLFQTQTILRKWKRRPESLMTTSSLELVARLTEAGLGYGVIPERVVKLIAPSLKMVSDSPEVRDEIALVYRPEFGKVVPERALLDIFRKAF